jgi:predicted DNA binding protein
MWSVHFTVENKDSVYTQLTKKYAVTDHLYPVNVKRKGKHRYIIGIHMLSGEPKEKRGFAQALRRHKKTVRFEQYGDVIMLMMREDEPFYEFMYDPELYNPTPVVIREGKETWVAIAFDRGIIQTLIAAYPRWERKFSGFTLHHLRKANPSDLYFPKFIPSLAPQQKLAFQLAAQHGYYSIPRKADLRALASMMHISVSTYQEHLRKAESRLLPFFGDVARNNTFSTDTGK